MNNFSKSLIENSLREEMLRKNIWSPNCPVSLDRLNLLKVSYIDFENNHHHDGSLVVFDVIADNVLNIFRILYQKSFPINSIKLINDYDGDDKKSMIANNSSSFMYRPIENSNLISLHSYGLAIDINPLQNPYLTTEYNIGKTAVNVYPPQGMEFINRRNIRPGMVESVMDENNLTIINIFEQNNFSIWGGRWNYPIDWHHFQVTRKQAETLAKMTYSEGVKFLKTM